MSATNPKRTNQPSISGYQTGNGDKGNRGNVGLIAIGSVLLISGILFAVLKPARKDAEPIADSPSTEKTRPSIGPSGQTVGEPRVARPRFSAGAPPVRETTPASAPAVRPATPSILDSLPRTAETQQAAGIIDRLLQIGSNSTTPVTVEQAAQITEQVRQIMNLGTPALAAIHDFLQKSVDLNFGKTSAEPGAGPFSLRASLLQALSGIGGPEAVALAAGTLQNTAVPGEVGLLARMLDQMAPGQYTDAAVNASREALRSAAADPNGEHDIASLFQVMQKHGGPAVVDELKTFSNQWRYYSLIALGGLPENAGVPALVELATGPGAQASGYQQLASRLLAEVAPTHPDAQRALLDQARAGQISNWSEVTAALTGFRLEYAQDFPSANNNAGPAARTTQTHHVVAGNQNFRTVQSPIPPSQLQQNQAFIDQLLTVTTDPVGQAALLKARASLTGQ